MTTYKELLQQGRQDLIWEKYCGYLDLTMKEFMEIQNRLLMEQVVFLRESKLGKHFLGDHKIESMDDFRKIVPLTTYDDYVPFLMEKDEKNLPREKYMWARTSGKSGKYPCKWIPYSQRIYDKMAEVVISAMIQASCSEKGDVQLESGDVVLLATAPRPYTSGYISYTTYENADVRFVPPLDEAEKMEYGERVNKGFLMAMDTGLDIFFGLAMILGKMGERFASGSGGVKISKEMLKPRTIRRLLIGYLKAKIQKRPLLPKDIWKLKGIMTGGMDTEIYRERLEYYWGRKPLEGYACTEGGMIAMQAWNFKGMTLFPDCDFYEFIPYDEYMKNKADPTYKPKTVLFDEIKPGIYEIVFTNLLGGALMRYRVGDLINFIALEDKEIGVKLPQFKFYSRADDLIDLGTMVKLTETDIWMGIEKAGIEYVDWTARKEIVNADSLLHLYIEMKPGIALSADAAALKIKESMAELNEEFSDTLKISGEDILQVTLLPEGAFNNYIDMQRKAGADLAHLKPPHMQPRDNIIERLFGNK
jgi:hypothetical protein